MKIPYDIFNYYILFSKHRYNELLIVNIKLIYNNMETKNRKKNLPMCGMISLPAGISKRMIRKARNYFIWRKSKEEMTGDTVPDRFQIYKE